MGYGNNFLMIKPLFLILFFYLATYTQADLHNALIETYETSNNKKIKLEIRV